MYIYTHICIHMTISMYSTNKYIYSCRRTCTFWFGGFGAAPPEDPRRIWYIA